MSAFPGGRAPVRCEICKAPDAHDAAHAAGCPYSGVTVSKAELMRLALRVERGWAAAGPRPALTRRKEWIRANERELQQAARRRSA